MTEATFLAYAREAQPDDVVERDGQRVDPAQLDPDTEVTIIRRMEDGQPIEPAERQGTHLLSQYMPPPFDDDDDEDDEDDG